MTTLLLTIGLGLDIVGVLLLARYGLPPAVAPGGIIGLAVRHDVAEEEKGYRYKWISGWALRLIVLGFGLQILSAWWPILASVMAR